MNSRQKAASAHAHMKTHGLEVGQPCRSKSLDGVLARVGVLGDRTKAVVALPMGREFYCSVFNLRGVA